MVNLTTFITNQRRGIKFFISWMLNALCLIRIITCAVRISWARDPRSSTLAIVAQVFNSAGILIIYIVNIVFAQRILRARNPAIGWNPILSNLLKIFYVLIFGTLIMGIVSLVLSINTTNTHTLQAIRDVSLAIVTFITVITMVPILFLAIACLVRSSDGEETFGTGSMASKILIVTISSCIAAIIAGFKTGTVWEPVRPSTNPAWYHSKAAFYCFNFMLEIIIVALFIISRVDKRFHVPNGCKRAGDYSRKASILTEEGKQSIILESNAASS